MTTNVGQALPGFAAAHAGSKQSPNAKSHDKSFGAMVHDDETPAPKGNRAAEPHDPRPSKREPAAKPQTANAETGKTASRSVHAKVAKDKAEDVSDKSSVDNEAIGQSEATTPLQDHLPLVLALHDIKHFSASRTGENNLATSDQPSRQAGDDSTVSAPASPAMPRKHRAASATGLDTTPRQERVAAGDGMAAKDPMPRADAFAAASVKLQDKGGAILPLPADQTPVELAAPTAPRPTPAIKGPDDAQSAAPSIPGKQASAVGRVDIVAEQSFPAPAQSPINLTSSIVVDALASDIGQRNAVSTPAASLKTASSVAVPTHVLKIELHPAELGVVTASLRLTGEQLSIELKPQTHEAYRHLATDSDAIVKSLRGLGFDVDKVTILQPSIAVHAAQRNEAANSQAVPQGRDQSAFQPGSSSGNSAGSGGQQPQRNRDDNAQDFGRAPAPSREHAGGDMFI